MSISQRFQTGRQVPFSDEELLSREFPITKAGQYLNDIAFPLGGIGTGCISLSGRGELIDWEIFNRPNKGYRPDNTYFILHACEEGQEPIFRVIEGRLQPPYDGTQHGPAMYRGYGFGPARHFGSGFLRFEDCSFTGEFPFARIDFADHSVPVHVSTTAWSPFIPLDDVNSSLPAAVFEVTLTNVTQNPVQATVALGIQNILGYPEIGHSRNDWIDLQNCRGIMMSTERHATDSPRYGTMVLVTPDDDVTYQVRFESDAWFAQNESLMDAFGQTGLFNGPRQTRISPSGTPDTAHLGIRATLQPGERVTRTFILAWMMPNFEKYWGAQQGTVWPVWQARKWPSARDVACYLTENIDSLRSRSRAFADALQSSTVPGYVIDAVSSQASILRTPTVTRLPDGTLYGWEGCHADSGCCEGSCTHVWTYAQTIAHLFPALERGMRNIDFAMDLSEEDGHMQFRMDLPPGTMASHRGHAAADGQMGNILRVYREWQISGDDDWMRKLWPSVKKALEYAWVDWDRDRDGLLEGVHHNTLDIEFHGPDTVCGTMYLAALRAGETMARFVDDHETADEYKRIYESGRCLSDERLFDGEYYFQHIPDGVDAPYQYGTGCICDQLLGQWHARMYGLGNLLDPDHIRSAIASVYRYNFRDDFYSHHNPHRVYSLNDDRGLLICTWPKGGRPSPSVTYAFETFAGFEYEVGALLIYEGFIREGLTVCKAIRDRHDGHRRNPYNEFECGSHYARSMANYSYLLALSGFRYSAPTRTLYFDPVMWQEDFRVFFSVDSGWGTISQRVTEAGIEFTIEIVEGDISFDRLICGENAIDCPRGYAAVNTPYAITLKW